MTQQDLSRLLEGLESIQAAFQTETDLALTARGAAGLAAALEEALNEPFSSTRAGAARALMTRNDWAAIPVILRALASGNIGIRLSVAMALRDYLEAVLDGRLPRRGWLWTLDARSLRDGEAAAMIKALVRCCGDEDLDVRSQAAAALLALRAMLAASHAEGYGDDDDDDGDGGPWSGSRDDDDDDGDDGGWSGSGTEGRALSMIEREIDYVVEHSDTADSPERRAEIRLYRDDEEGLAEENELDDREALRADTWYLLRLALVGAPQGIPVSGGPLEPIRKVERAGPVQLLVTAEDEGDGFEIAEPVRPLTLSDDKDGDFALFRIRPKARTAPGARARIHIRIYYQLNLVEWLVLEARVVGRFDDSADGPDPVPLSFRQKALALRYAELENLEPRAMHVAIDRRGPHFEFAFVVDVDGDDKDMSLNGVARIPVAELEDELHRIRNFWNRTATGGPFATGLEGAPDDFVAQIRLLAETGSNLWAKLFRREAGSALWTIGEWLAANPLPPGLLIQVSTTSEAGDFIFPWALLFDRTMPEKPYELPDLDGFWGIRYCVEQRLAEKQPSAAEKAAAADVPVLLSFFRCQRLRHVAEQDALFDRLQSRPELGLKVSRPPLEDADKCYGTLEGTEAHLLYFYAHGYTRLRQAADAAHGPRQQQRYVELLQAQRDREEPDSPLWLAADSILREIEAGGIPFDRSWIELTYGRLYLDWLYRRVSKLPSRPLVILNLCESGQIVPSLSESFVHFFLDRGAKAVLGTECDMTTEFAHPFAERLLVKLVEGQPIGEALRSSRLSFMEEHRNPLGLAYTLFGSGTARVRPTAAAQAKEDAHG